MTVGCVEKHRSGEAKSKIGLARDGTDSYANVPFYAILKRLWMFRYVLDKNFGFVFFDSMV